MRIGGQGIGELVRGRREDVLVSDRAERVTTNARVGRKTSVGESSYELLASYIHIGLLLLLFRDPKGRRPMGHKCHKRTRPLASSFQLALYFAKNMSHSPGWRA